MPASAMGYGADIGHDDDPRPFAMPTKVESTPPSEQGLADTPRLPPGVELPEGLVEELTALGVRADAPSRCSRT